MHAVAVERSLPPPSYADKVRARFGAPAVAQDISLTLSARTGGPGRQHGGVPPRRGL